MDDSSDLLFVPTDMFDDALEAVKEGASKGDSTPTGYSVALLKAELRKGTQAEIMKLGSGVWARLKTTNEYWQYLMNAPAEKLVEIKAALVAK
jgi:hypothetical protein